MATATWSSLGTRSSNFASTTLDSLGNGSTSTLVTYDNSTDKALYGLFEVALGSFTSTTGASITLRAFATANGGSTVPDATGSVGGGEIYQQMITVGASAKVIVFPMIRLYPVSMRFCITNNGGASFAASSNSMIVTPYNETIA